MRETMRRSNIKKRIAVIGITIALAIGMVLPAYANSYTIGDDPLSGENIISTPVTAEEWYGSYSLTVDGKTYWLEIAPCWDDPNTWSMTAISFPTGNRFELSSWTGTLTPDDLEYETTAIISVNDKGEGNFDWGTLDGGLFNAICHASPNHELDLCVCRGVGEVSGTCYLGVMLADDTSTNAFPSDDYVYTKISDAYGIVFTDYSDGYLPDWYWPWTEQKNRSINWDIQSQTPAGQPPISALPNPLNWYDDGDDSAVG